MPEDEEQPIEQESPEKMPIPETTGEDLEVAQKENLAETDKEVKSAEKMGHRIEQEGGTAETTFKQAKDIQKTEQGLSKRLVKGVSKKVKQILEGQRGKEAEGAAEKESVFDILKFIQTAKEVWGEKA